MESACTHIEALRESKSIKDVCALCKTLECCPEHCCNVSLF